VELASGAQGRQVTAVRLINDMKIRSFIPGVVALIVATVLFCLPGKEFPESGWFEKIFLDKWIHVGLFASLVALWTLPFIHRIDEIRQRVLFVWIALGFIVYGVAIEFIQGWFIPHRSFGVDDIVADAVGCGAGLLFALRQMKIKKA